MAEMYKGFDKDLIILMDLFDFPKVREQAKDWILSNGFHLEVR